ncbi:MAG: T9SS type A sorting domain-containing protein [Candidatus Eisenbacteria sp.]|nr:T9SS type A sorting domain-containing protein [Candidatus Eisenbacteria bacterium]
MNRRVAVSILVFVALALACWSIHGPGRTGKMTSEEIALQIKAEKKALKAELKAEGKLYEPDLLPNEWGYVQRAYPYERINFDQLREAIADARAMRMETKRDSRAAWTERGPSNIGARVTDMVVHPTNSSIVYAAHASSGVFRTTDGGNTWEPISDDLPVLTIGAMALDPLNPDILYVGTGEANANSYSFFGMGLYKSIDGGASWAYKGLEETRYIARVVVDPLNTDRIWAAGTGSLFGTNPERGVYRSVNGGDSWDLVLSITDSTACTDIAIDPTKPDTVYAAMWERVRGLTYRQSAGPTSGIYRSYDGGDTWTELTSGLPSGDGVGRIGLSVCATSPNVIYAMYADHPGYFAGVYKSTNYGDSWIRTSDSALDNLLSSFGWYFGQIRVDPNDPDRVFAMGVPFYRSQNGGSSWSQVGSNNSGTSWTKLYDQPTNQFYAIGIDYLNPQRLYGGTQDNGTLRTPDGGVDNWDHIFGGDGFYTLVDPTDSDVIYCEYQFGNLYKSTDFGDYWDWAMDGINGGDRRNWSMPVVMDPSDHLTLYCGTYRVYRTTNGAGYWNAISADLTNGNQGANLGTITTIAVAPTDPDVIYAGTDDSNVWVTQNGGGSWTNISGSLPDRWVTRVAVDPADASVACVTFSGLRWDEAIGYVYRTTDSGVSWTDVTGNLPGAPANVVVVDPDQTSRLFVGTDVGCFYTENLGAVWTMLGSGLPAVPVYDLRLHQPTRTLVAGTHGRSMHSFDLSTLTGVAAGEIPRPVVAGLSNHPNPFNPNTTITFALTEPSEISLDVFDLAGRKVRSLVLGRRSQGTHQAEWDGRNENGNLVASGVYFARLETDAGVETRKLNLVK